MNRPSGLESRTKIPLRLAGRNKKSNMPAPTTNQIAPQPPMPPRVWPRRPEPEPDFNPAPIKQRGSKAILHSETTRGRRSKDFPDLNITATALQLGVSKSHLAKVLAGFHRPSITLAVRLSEVLGRSLEYVVALYKKAPTAKNRKSSKDTK
jgi:hypothetical protein